MSVNTPSTRSQRYNTFRSCNNNCDFSTTSFRIGLHFDASLTNANSWAGVDFKPFALKILDFKELGCGACEEMNDAAS
jgi:hypothetical protein